MLADGSREHSAAKAYCAAGTDVRMADHMPKMRVASQNFCETRYVIKSTKRCMAISQLHGASVSCPRLGRRKRKWL
jgi:hypothetical protein